MLNHNYPDSKEGEFVKFKISRKQHNEIFGNRKIKWFMKCDYFYNENMIIIRQYTKLSMKLLLTVAFPVIVLIQGVANTKSLWGELMELYNEKKGGHFIESHVHKESKRYWELKEAAKL